MVCEMWTITKYAMPMATAVKGFWRFFSGWTSLKTPAGPEETVMDAIVKE